MLSILLQIMLIYILCSNYKSVLMRHTHACAVTFELAFLFLYAMPQMYFSRSTHHNNVTSLKHSLQIVNHLIYNFWSQIFLQGTWWQDNPPFIYLYLYLWVTGKNWMHLNFQLYYLWLFAVLWNQYFSIDELVELWGRIYNPFFPYML